MTRLPGRAGKRIRVCLRVIITEIELRKKDDCDEIRRKDLRLERERKRERERDEKG